MATHAWAQPANAPPPSSSASPSSHDTPPPTPPGRPPIPVAPAPITVTPRPEPEPTEHMSLGGRVALAVTMPLVGVLVGGGIGSIFTSCSDEGSFGPACLGAPAEGALIGAGVGLVFGLVLGQVAVVKPDKPYRPLIAPTANVGNGHTSFGLAGRF